MAGSSGTPIILLKTKSSPIDNYEEFLSQEGYRPAFIPVLEHVFGQKGLDFLQTCIRNGAFSSTQRPSGGKIYGGLIFTSQRAVEAFAHVVSNLQQDGISVETLFSPQVPIYVVGPATGRSIRALKLPCSIIGEESGNADVLAELVLKHYNQLALGINQEESLSKPALLFVVGEQRRDIVPKTLQSEALPLDQRVTVDEVPVYETAVKPNFAADFQSAIDSHTRGTGVQWVVVFSPTGSKIMLEHLGLLDAATGKADIGVERRTLIATIGPTTRNYMLREFGFDPDVCSSAPSPEGLCKSITEYYSRHPELSTG